MKMKQVIVMRKDLNMRKGKMIAQGAHASMGAVYALSIPCDGYIAIGCTEDEREWFLNEFTKICVGVDSEEELVDIFDKAKASEIRCALITDSGLTEFKGIPTKTCMALGPAPNDAIDVITGHLKLL